MVETEVAAAGCALGGYILGSMGAKSIATDPTVAVGVATGIGCAGGAAISLLGYEITKIVNTVSLINFLGDDLMSI